MAIPFTHREIERAWRDNLSASNHTNKNNAHRLLLFYAVECGLKAIIMKKSGWKNCRTDNFSEIHSAQHNINRLLDILNANTNLKLPPQLRMRDIKNNHNQAERREINCGQINQMWRYGGKLLDISDQDLENKLLLISNWIQRELL